VKNLYLLKWDQGGGIIGIWNSYERACRAAIKILKQRWRDFGLNPKEFRVIEEKWLIRADDEQYPAFPILDIKIEQYRINHVYGTDFDEGEDDGGETSD
jgi:hypothetical protein